MNISFHAIRVTNADEWGGEQVYNISKDLLPFMWSGGSAGNTAIEKAKR